MLPVGGPADAERDVPAPRGTDYDELLARARDQRAWLEEQRLAATGRVGAAADV